MKKKLLAIALAVCMVLGLMPGLPMLTAQAAGTVHTVAAWDDPLLGSGMPGVVSGDTIVLPAVTAVDTVLSIPSGITALSVQGRAAYTNLSIVLSAGHPGLTLTIQDLNLAASSTIDLSGASASSLLLEGSNTIGSRIVVPEGMTLSINGSGSLAANAGVGGGHDGSENGGTIVILGGTVTAQGEEGTAGIGGGYGPARGADVVIWDGNITAIGGGDGSGDHGGAGIGSGSSTGNPGTVTIHGGTIIAIGGARGAGIGSGRANGAGGSVTINGGDITTTGGDDGADDNGGAGIGSGASARSGSVAIHGGIIHAYGGANAAGIGSGSRSGAVAFTITGGTITAVGGTGIGEFDEAPSSSGGAGIGGGYVTGNGDCSISGGTITVQGGYGSAGIGSGFKSNGMPLTMSGGTITATGGENGAGIGSGILGGGVDLAVSGGRITAIGGTNAQDIGASLLSQEDGLHGASGSLTVTGWALITANDTISPTGSNGPYTISLFTAPGVSAGVQSVTVAADDSSFSFTQSTGTDGTLGGIYLLPNTDVLISVAGYNVKLASDTTYGSSVDFNSGSAAAALDIYLSATSGVTAPSVTTNNASSVTASGATLNGEVTASGGATVTARGFVYGLSADPAIGGADVTQAAAVSGGTGTFTVTISDLAASTAYHVRAYATNSEGTAYGSDVKFTTLSTVIHVDTEDGGEVVIGEETAWAGAPSSTKGSLFWNGSAWVSNDTVAHMYFTDSQTGTRLNNYTDVAIPAAAGASTQNGVGFTAEAYTYQVAAADGSGTYQYTGIKYTITQADGKTIILLSRGMGRGTGTAYLEAFIESPTSGTLAIRDGSVLYSHAGTAAETAAISNPTTGVMGLLRTADVYWFDMNGGSDMGGLTYSPHTEALPGTLVTAAHPANLNQVARFDLMLMSEENALYRYILSPSLTSEIFIPITAPTVTGISPTSGPEAGGTSVTITGTNFTGASAVKFGGSNAVYTVSSATQIITVAPAGAGMVHITVTTANGTSATSNADRFTYTSSGGGGGGGGGTVTTTTYTADVQQSGVKTDTLTVTVSGSGGTASLSETKAAALFSAGNTSVVMPAISGVSAYTLELPASAFDAGQKGGVLTLSTGVGSVTLPDNMLGSLTGTDGKTAGITVARGDTSGLTDAEKVAVGSRPLVQLALTLGGTKTEWNNPGAPVTVKIPYTPTAEELKNPESILIWYLDGSGKPVCVPNGHYDAATGTVTFTTTHFSNYAVGYNAVSFKDVSSGAWYHGAVSFIAARGITTGTGKDNFSPDAKLTRGEFIVLLMRAYDIAPDAAPTDNFADAGSTYYTNYLAATKRLGISAGVGGNMFAPGKEITRQEMFTLLYNALNVINSLPQGSSGRTLSDFTDAGQIATWASDAMMLLVETGTISGSGGRLNPTGTTTRAEMAQVLYNLLIKS